LGKEKGRQALQSGGGGGTGRKALHKELRRKGERVPVERRGIKRDGKRKKVPYPPGVTEEGNGGK